MTTLSPSKPWGLTRATPHLPEEPLPWVETWLDPVTQVTVFLDEHGHPVDITAGGTSRSFATVSMSRPHDGGKNAPQVADDSPNDIEKD
nr:putative ATP-grasp-modified RiPP [Nonomuraea longispora]